ncbi:hypothetical protein BH10CYA1_BH10CYA1_64590 [soil metagenome]
MNTWREFLSTIQLHVHDRIEKADALRQESTAKEILRRFHSQPGLILADEVGMGKTFVALAVAASVALSKESRRRPVVVMVPPSLKEKWPDDFAIFQAECLPEQMRSQLIAKKADSAVELLRLLDDPLKNRCNIIFLTHGAMYRGLTDGWIKLAIIQAAIHGRRNSAQMRRDFSKCAGRLLSLGWAEKRCPEIWDLLLPRQPSEWLNILQDNDFNIDDDPVPKTVVKALEKFDGKEVREALESIPLRQSARYEDRIADTRQVLTKILKEVWRDCLLRAKLRLPLLIMDEAHHLKNPETRLASLFQGEEAKGDAEELTRGLLAGVFERMLFLTATPFQLGHRELCSVLERFTGINWNTSRSNGPIEAEFFRSQIHELRKRLDTAQTAALSLDAAWGKLSAQDLIVDGKVFTDVESWWETGDADGAILSMPGQAARDIATSTAVKMRAAEELLRPWVIRHLKPRTIYGTNVPRRELFPGASIKNEEHQIDVGIEVSESALLPFLLAARATICNPDKRPVFAEGLASSYEAFLHTRKSKPDLLDEDEQPDQEVGSKDGEWYLKQLDYAVTLKDRRDSVLHPKIAATAQRALLEWDRGEKVLIFCHYRQTGKVLRHVISGLMHDRIIELGAQRLNLDKKAVSKELNRLGERFFDKDSPIRHACDIRISKMLEGYPGLVDDHDTLLEVTRRFIRTPSFLVRYFPLGEFRREQDAVDDAFSKSDDSGMSLSGLLSGFFEFLENRCVDSERQRFLEAIEKVQTGVISGIGAFLDDELSGHTEDGILPNVRLVNGETDHNTRQRLMLTFNSPFFPEILIASNVLAEGVDLHRFCRQVIHHDLCWNPSTLEQRTGRVDRIGAKAEQCGKPICIYLPYLAATQDEKMYRVVMDRERWFKVVMGENMKIDARTTDKLAQRVPLPESLAKKLAFRLEIT